MSIVSETESFQLEVMAPSVDPSVVALQQSMEVMADTLSSTLGMFGQMSQLMGGL